MPAEMPSPSADLSFKWLTSMIPPDPAPMKVTLMPIMSPAKWASLSEKSRWDVMVALRGPDCKGNRELIKWFSTAAIRGALTKVMPSKVPTERVGGLINADLGLVIIPSDIPRSCEWGARHFFDHVQEATGILGLYMVILPYEVWDPLMQGSSGITSVVKQVLTMNPSQMGSRTRAAAEAWLETQ